MYFPILPSDFGFSMIELRANPSQSKKILESVLFCVPWYTLLYLTISDKYLRFV